VSCVIHGPCLDYFSFSLNTLDKSGERFFHITAPWWGVIVGYIIAVSTFSIGGRYFSMFLMASGYAGNNLR